MDVCRRAIIKKNSVKKNSVIEKREIKKIKNPVQKTYIETNRADLNIQFLIDL